MTMNRKLVPFRLQQESIQKENQRIIERIAHVKKNLNIEEPKSY